MGKVNIFLSKLQNGLRAFIGAVFLWLLRPCRSATFQYVSTSPETQLRGQTLYFDFQVVIKGGKK